jgi:ADP-heptose:LPS heptosyltransferase
MNDLITFCQSGYKKTSLWNFLRFAKRWCVDGIVSSFPKKINDSSLLIVRLDAIGDYILFHNYIKVIKNSKRFKDHHITLCGNEAWRELAEILDKTYIDRFIWLHRGKFINDLKYRMNKIREISQNKYDVVINPTFSRESLFADSIVRTTKAKEKLGLIGDSLHNPVWQKNIADKWYTKLFQIEDSTVFEFCRTREFIGKILNENINVIKPSIDIPFQYDNGMAKTQYAIICPGGTNMSHRWDIKYFLKVSEYLYNRYKLDSIIVGNDSDQVSPTIQQEIKKCPYIDNKIGKTNLVNLISIIEKSSIVITNETSIAHIAVAKGNPVVVISNGNKYGRFTEYPGSVYKDIHYVYAQEVSQMTMNFDEKVRYFQSGSSIDINSVSVTHVTEIIDKIINNNKS